ncbi:hypothetical protein CCUS01_15416 [Colletotrichum cuscutae]|uniref:Heterokaryon incompatibility domain-containing protein n=1 Tax=Colletotrichum cuscutae TaxID=1209917 RepID=A0AAI9Y4J3_9PEZI|nr:hypothetical protein CCUS01_15416 [Colletotrichum cuscutae]
MCAVQNVASKANQSHKSGLRLIDPETTPISGPYAALSYCWGSNPSFLRLTAWNQNRLRAGIADDELPIAFCEALKAVRCLDILYIWIDSLCIIQILTNGGRILKQHTLPCAYIPRGYVFSMEMTIMKTRSIANHRIAVAAYFGASFPDGLSLEDNFFREAKDNWTLTTVWFRVVEEYTNLALRLGQAMDDICIWGHFNKSLIRSLYWSVGRIHVNLKRGRATRRSQFPSWSWASMDGPISFEHEVFGTMVTSPLASFERYQISTILLQLQSGGTVYTFAPTAYSRIINCAREFTAFLDGYQNPTEGAHVSDWNRRDPATLKSYDFVLGIFVKKTGHLLDGRFIFHRVGCGYIELKD